MKKAKIMLSAIAVLAIVGGALAFKAKNLNGSLYCVATKDTSCPTTPSTYIVTSVTEPHVTSYCSTVAADCTSQGISSFVTLNQ